MEFFRKIQYLISKRYNPYPFYWFDLLTERKLKNRVGECKNCYDCCKFDDCGNVCEHVDKENIRCNVYDKRKCDKWFPISKKELELMKEWKPFMNCNYDFKK